MQAGYGGYGAPQGMGAPPGGGACSSCGRAIQPSGATLSTHTGLPVCASCAAGEGLAAQQGRAVKSLAFGALSGAVGAPMVSLCLCGPAGLVMAIAAIVSAVRAITLLGQPDYQRRPDRTLLFTVSIVAIVVGGLGAMLYGLMVMGAIGSAMLRR